MATPKTRRPASAGLDGAATVAAPAARNARRRLPTSHRRASTIRRRRRPPASGSSRTTAWRDASVPAPSRSGGRGRRDARRARRCTSCSACSLTKPSRSQTGSEKSSAVTARDRSDACKMPSAEKAKARSGSRCLASSRHVRLCSAPPADMPRRIRRDMCRYTSGGSARLQRRLPGRNTLCPSSMRGGDSQPLPGDGRGDDGERGQPRRAGAR